MATRSLFFSAPQGTAVNICKTSPPARQNKAGNDEDTHENNYTKHNFRNTARENIRRHCRDKEEGSNLCA